MTIGFPKKRGDAWKGRRHRDDSKARMAESKRAAWKAGQFDHLRKPRARLCACAHCHGPFEAKSRGRILGSKYCSQRCQRLALHERAAARARTRTRRCPGCDQPFSPRWIGRAWQKFCSPRCQAAHAAALRYVDVECAECGKAFLKRRAYVRRSERSFCSRTCLHAFHRGENHPQHRGTEAPDSSEWRRLARAARVLDNHTCRQCSRMWQPGERLYPVDHIYPRRCFADQDVANQPINLATLCHTCHAKKTTVAEAAWLRGDVLAFEQYLLNVLTPYQRGVLQALAEEHRR